MCRHKTRQTDRDVQVVRELVDGQSCHVGKCLLLPSTPTSRRYKLHMDPWSKKTLRSHELWTHTTTHGLLSRLWSPVVCFFGVAADSAAAALRRRLELRNKGRSQEVSFWSISGKRNYGVHALVLPLDPGDFESFNSFVITLLVCVFLKFSNNGFGSPEPYI